jgi:hypothetical protein
VDVKGKGPMTAYLLDGRREGIDAPLSVTAGPLVQ